MLGGSVKQTPKLQRLKTMIPVVLSTFTHLEGSQFSPAWWLCITHYPTVQTKLDHMTGRGF
jgi:hypothetical protein